MDTKPGWKSTEFWTTIGTVLAAVLVPVLATEHADKVQTWAASIGGVAACVAAGCYALARGMAKRKG